MQTTQWENRVADAWASFDARDGADFLDRIEKLAGELPPGDPDGLFERGAAVDSTGRPELAVPLYREALAAGLAGERRRRAVIQMAGSLRHLDRAQEAVALLTDELAAGSDHLDDAVRAMLALALTDVGREREAVSVAVGALAAHLPRYRRSMAGHARLLMEPDPVADPEADVRS